MGAGAIFQDAAPVEPTRVNVSPEVFARLLQGGSLTQEEMDSLAAVPAPAPEEEVATEAAVVEVPAVAEAEKKKKPSKKVRSTKRNTRVAAERRMFVLAR